MDYKSDQDFFKELEEPWKPRLPAKKFYVIRVDGRAFHTWTRGLQRPFDPKLREAMVDSAIKLASQVDGAICCYTYSDEISVVFTDRLSEMSQVWFGGVVTKISSIAASIITANFNSHFEDRPQAGFDGRVFCLDSPKEVERYLNYRSRDCYRNGINSICDTLFSHAELHGKNGFERAIMLGTKGVSLDEVDPPDLFGTYIAQEPQPARIEYKNKRTGETKVTEFIRNLWTPSHPELPGEQFTAKYKELQETAI